MRTSRTTRAGLTGTLLLMLAFSGCSRPHERAPVSGADRTEVRAQAPSLFELKFPLTDTDGRTRTLAEFRGTPFVASMVYTNCTSVCPRVTADLKTLEKALPPDVREHTRFLLFSLDPGRDTPAALTKFAEQHALDHSRWTLLASSEDDMRTLAAVLGVKFRPDEGGEIAHSAVIVVCNPDGTVRHRQVGLQDRVDDLVAAVEEAGR
jgi:protein SCO1/2